MSQHGPDRGGPEHNLPVEPDVLPLAKLFVVLGAIVAVVLGSMITVWQVFTLTAEQELSAKDHAKPSAILSEYRERDRQLLRNYSVVEGKTGRYRIPIEKAIEQLTAKPDLIGPLVPIGSTDKPGSDDPGVTQ